MDEIEQDKINLLVNPDHHDRLCPSDPDQFVDTPDSPPAQLGQQDHALDVVVLEQVDVGAHVRDRTDVDHHHVVDLGVLLLVEPARDNHGAAFSPCNRAGTDEEWHCAQISIKFGKYTARHKTQNHIR